MSTGKRITEAYAIFMPKVALDNNNYVWYKNNSCIAQQWRAIMRVLVILIVLGLLAGCTTFRDTFCYNQSDQECINDFVYLGALEAGNSIGR
jgi:hypothetical protein